MLHSYRFHDLFPDPEMVRELQTELDYIIQAGVRNIVQLLKNQEQGNLVLGDGEDELGRKTRTQQTRGLTRKQQRPLDDTNHQKEKKDEQGTKVSAMHYIFL